MKTITIPKRFGYPQLDICINGKKYILKSGIEISVEDEVAKIIENALALEPKLGRNLSKFAKFVEGKSTELTASDLDGIETVSRYVFYECDNLKRIVIPKGVTSIGHSAFRNCSYLSSVEIPESILSIDYRAFESCSNLARVIVKALTPPSIQTDTFKDIPATCVFEVPSKSLEAYKSAANWSAFANQIVAI